MILKAVKSGEYGKTVDPSQMTDTSSEAPCPELLFSHSSVSGKKVNRTPEDTFRIPAIPDKKIPVIGLKPGQVVTEHLVLKPSIDKGYLCSDPARDLAMLCVLEKNKGTGRLAIGFVKGLGLHSGALASSVAHDAHNVVVAGMDTQSIRTAFSWLISTGGGLAACRNENVLASLPLTVGGLMNPGHADHVITGLNQVEEAAISLGTNIEHPFMAVSFLCLSVIPEVKLTDQGYVDLSRGGLQSLFVELQSE